MTTKCPRFYEWIYETIHELQSYDHSISTVLELGAFPGFFVEFLRERGFDAEGVDSEYDENNFVPYLHKGELASLEDIFGEKLFDLAVARGVFCDGSQYAHLFDCPPLTVAGIEYEMSHEHLITGAIQKSIDGILKNVFNQLRPGGLLVVHEDYIQLDQIAFSRKTVQDIGYQVLSLERQEAILQKPLQT